MIKSIGVIGAGTMGNGIAISSYPFASRLLAYLADDAPSTQAPWRQALGALLVAGLLGVLLWRPTAWRATVAGAALAVSLAICVSVSAAAAELIPDGRPPAYSAKHPPAAGRLRRALGR